MVELVDKDIKTALAIYYTFKKLKERLNMLSINMKDLKKTQIEIPEVKITR